MEKRIIVEPKNVYGKTLYYPACDISKFFLKIQGGKTLSFNTINTLAEVDFKIDVKAKMPKFM
jgi:hypothetical protein